MTPTLAHTGNDVHEHEDYYNGGGDDDDDHHRNLLVYCLAIIPLLASMILLPNTCYSVLRRRADRQRKTD